MNELISHNNSSAEAAKAVALNKARIDVNVWSVPLGDIRFDLNPFSHLSSKPASSPAKITAESLSKQKSDDPCAGIEATCSVGFKQDLRKSANSGYVSCAVEKQEQDKWFWRYGEEACGITLNGKPAEVEVVPAANTKSNVIVSGEPRSEELAELMQIEEKGTASKILEHATQPYVYGPALALAAFYISRRSRKDRNNGSVDEPQPRRQLNRTEAAELRIQGEIRAKKYDNPKSPLYGMGNSSMVVRNGIEYLVEKSAESPKDTNTSWRQRVGAARVRDAYLDGGNGAAHEALEITLDKLENPESIRVIKADKKHKRGRRFRR